MFAELQGTSGVDPGVGKGRGTNRQSVARWLGRIELIAS